MKGDIYGNYKRSEEGKRTNRKPDYVAGVWENIAPTPIKVADKYELKKACQAESARQGRVIIPKIFMKPKSQGKGIEWNF